MPTCTSRRLLLLGLLFACCIVLGVDAPAQQPSDNPADAIVGDWRPADMNVDVRIFPSQGQYLGGIVKAENQELISKEMMRGITYDPKTTSWKGEVFAFKRGQFVPMSITMTPTGFRMVAGTGILSKTIDWVRVQ